MFRHYFGKIPVLEFEILEKKLYGGGGGILKKMCQNSLTIIIVQIFSELHLDQMKMYFEKF